MGYVFALLAMLSIGVLGILSKLADRERCPPLVTTVVLFGGSAAVMGSYVGFFPGMTFRPPAFVTGTALAFGALALLAFWVFLHGLQFGKITTSWIFMNLSAIVPATLSVVIYNEPISLAKILVILLVVVSILLLWKDKLDEGRRAADHASNSGAPASMAPAARNGRIWITAMLGAFVLNGICPFGLRILAGRGMARHYTAVYLFYWYLAGLAIGLVWLMRTRKPLSPAGLLIGFGMALASTGGQLFMGLSMAWGAPGNVVYMLGMGASMCVVVSGGVLFFRERIGGYASLGIGTGLLAAMLLGATG